MVGTWFGHGQPDDKDAMYIDRMRRRRHLARRIPHLHQGQGAGPDARPGTGRWQGDMLILEVDTVNGSAAPRTDSYKMLAHSPTTQKYLSMALEFSLHAAAGGGRFQDADLRVDQLMDPRAAALPCPGRRRRPSAAASLAGTWFGQGEPFDKTEMYLDHFLPDGEIHSQFRHCREGQARDSTEDGTWAVSGDILTINVTAITARRRRARTSTGSIWSCRSASRKLSGAEFSVRRAAGRR